MPNVTQVTPPTSGVADDATRRVLDAIVSGWRIRNGEQDPNSPDRFVSVGDLKAFVETINNGYFQKGGRGYEYIKRVVGDSGTGSGGGTVITNVGVTVETLVAYLETTALWQDLIARITLIDGPTGALVDITDELDALGITVSGHTVQIGDIVVDITDINNISGTSGSASALKVWQIDQTVQDPSTGLAAAWSAITQVNTVSGSSTSANAVALYQLQGVVNHPTTGLAAAHAAITQINFVDVTSTSANAVSLALLTGQVNNPTTGLPSAHAAIADINNVSVASNSAAARSIATLNGTVYTPTIGLAAQIDAINNISVSSGSASAQHVANLDTNVYDPNTGLSRAHSRISEEKTSRTNSDNALAQQLNKFWADLGGSQALVTYGTDVVVNASAGTAVAWTQVQSAVRDNQGNYISSAAVRTVAETGYNLANNTAYGQYNVKIDVNGYISGYGLIVESAVNNTPSSLFAVNVDRFYIGKGGVGSSSPFVALTTPTYVDGKLYPAGIYMRDAFIANATIDGAKIVDASITNAKIGNAAIGTLQLGGNVVTVPNTTKYTGPRWYPSWGPLTITTYLNLDYPATVYASASYLQSQYGNDAAWQVALYINNVEVYNSGSVPFGRWQSNVAIAGMLQNVPAGSIPVTAYWMGATDFIGCNYLTLYAVATKR